MGGPIRIYEIKQIQKRYPIYNGIKCFIETGTSYGETIFPISPFFDELHTIELSIKHYLNAQKKAKIKKINNINFYLGDSAIILPAVIKNIREACIFFLDSHFCGKGTDSVKSNLPLLAELKSINLRNQNDLVIIDDYRKFGRLFPGREQDWRNITEKNVLNCFDRKKIFHYFAENDRFIILLRKI